MSSAQPLFSSLDRYLPSLLRLDNGTNSRYLWVGVVLALGVIIELGLRGGGRTLRLPTLNTSSTTWTYKEAKNNFVGNAKILLAEGLKKVRNCA